MSPSRLLQASAFLTAGDAQYALNPNKAVQIGPTFTLSVYMLFAGHVNRTHDDTGNLRDTTWKEAIHKAKVKLVRRPLRSTHASKPEQPVEGQGGHSATSVFEAVEVPEEPLMAGEGKISEFAYDLEIVEDFDDDRLHSFEEDEPQPGPYDDVKLAGIRESLPVYQVSKLFYADTGKILNIGSLDETNNPILLLKRDIHAFPPRRMMRDDESNYEWEQTHQTIEVLEVIERESQNDIDLQLHRESSVQPLEEEESSSEAAKAWCFPPDLDPEWLALEVYAEEEEESISDEEQGVTEESAYASSRPNLSDDVAKDDTSLVAGLAALNIDRKSSSPTSFSPRQSTNSLSPSPSPFGPIRSSLSLLEMLIRLTALQQFQQASHLSIPDELLTFFLEESSTTGAGGDGDERRRTRREARRKVGFDPYDESPVKRRGEEYQYQSHGMSSGSPQTDNSGYQYPHTGYDIDSPGWLRERSMTPQRNSDSWLHRSRNSMPADSNIPSSPVSPYRPLPKKTARPMDRVRQNRSMQRSSPLGRELSTDSDSSLGTSPGSPTLVNKKDAV